MLDPISPQPPHTVDRAVFRQRWNDLTFLHWPVDPAVIAPLLPVGTTPDLERGTAWVGLIPFEMSHVGILGTPPLPYLSRFPETNVRLYAHDDRGRRGVVFRSLEAGRLLPVLAAITGYHLPYKWAGMSIERLDSSRRYTSSRRWPGPRPASSRVHVRVGPRIEGNALEHFLTDRWGLFSTWYGARTAWAPITHEPWALHSAELELLDEDLLARAGISAVLHGRPHVMWSPGVSVRIGRPELL
ncbi:MAG: DUF2071 domain-containing protein [Mycobacteriales bacterium]